MWELHFWEDWLNSSLRPWGAPPCHHLHQLTNELTKGRGVASSWHLPAQQPLPVPHQKLQSQRLGQHVSWLLLGVNLLKGEGSIIPRSALQEVEALEVDVLGSGMHLGNPSICPGKMPMIGKA